MTITEATHALARKARFVRSGGRSGAPTAGTAALPSAGRDTIRLVDAMARVEPSWVEAVAVVQAVCAQLGAGEAVPALDAISISAAGAVTFAPTSAAPDLAAVRGAGGLLTTILRAGVCPMPLWDATNRAAQAPASFGTARAFGATLSLMPDGQGVKDLQAYVLSAGLRPPTSTAQPGIHGAGLASFVAGRGLMLLLVALCGIGAGLSVGAFVVSRALAVAPASATSVVSAPAPR